MAFEHIWRAIRELWRKTPSTSNRRSLTMQRRRQLRIDPLEDRHLLAIDHNWAIPLGGFGALERGIATTSNGDVVVTGSFSGTVDFDPGPSQTNLTALGGSDIFIAKYSAAGALQWANRIGETPIYTDAGTAVTVDTNGNILVTGQFTGNVDFDPGAGVTQLSSSGGTWDVFVLKLNASGGFVWARSVGAGSDDVGAGIATDSNGNVYTTGRFVNTVDFDPGPGTFNLNSGGAYGSFVLKLDASGTFGWAAGLTGNSTGHAVAVDAAQNVYVTGELPGASDFDPGAGALTLSSAGDHDIYVWKLTQSGGLGWARLIGSSGRDHGNGIAVDANGAVIVAGRFEQTVDFDPGAGVANLSSAGNSDGFIAKLNSLGNYVWAQRIGGTASDIVYGLALDQSGRPSIAGAFSGTVDFDPGAGVVNHVSAGGTDSFIIGLATDGSFIEGVQSGGGSDDSARAIAVDQTGYAAVAGTFSGTVDFNPGTSIENLTSSTATDSYAWRLGVGLSVPTANLSVSSTSLLENAGSASVIATLSSTSSQTVTVNLAFSGTATLNSDYIRSGASITIPAGSTTGSITITSVNDFTFEGDESVIIDVSTVINGIENGSQSVVATVLDDEQQSLTSSPFVVSITAINSAIMSTDTISASYNVSFSESVTGVDASDFVVATTGSAGATISLVTPTSGAVYAITINGIAGNGTLGLNLIDNGSIRDLAGNGLISATAPLSLNSQQTFAAGVSPESISLVDLNGDSKADLTVVNANNDTVSILLGNGNGTFQSQQVLSTGVGSNPIALAIADINGDGKPDLIITNYGSSSVQLLLGNGNGTFQTPQFSTVGSFPRATAVADFNGDGKLDLAVVNKNSNSVSVLLGNGNGTFQAQQIFGVGSAPKSIAAADINADGKPDIAVTNSASNSASVLLGNGDGTFQAQQTYSTGATPWPIALADVNGDGKPDLVAGNYSSDKTVSVLLGNGNGTFQTQQTYPTGASARALTVADINGDGNSDLIVANRTDNTVSLLLGNGNGTFRTQQTLATGSIPRAVAVADVNGDGRLDLAVANAGDNNVSVFTNAVTGSFTGPTYTIVNNSPNWTGTIVKDIVSGVGGSTPTSMTQVGNLVFFVASTADVGTELWRTDGTFTGTRLVVDVFPGVSSSLPRNLINVNGVLFFSADDGVNGEELWKSDGSSSGTILVRNISPPGARQIRFFSNVNGVLVFSADDNVTGRELWRSDGTSSGTVLIRDIRTTGAGYSGSSDPDAFVQVGNLLFFAANDQTHDREPWRTDGTFSGTTLIRDVNPGGFPVAASVPRNPVEANGIVYFEADLTGSGVGRQLWRSDLTSSGTQVVADIRASFGSEFEELVNVNGTVFFRGNNGVNGWELWKTNGTSSGTVLVRDIQPGSSSGMPKYLTNVHGTLFFSATNGVSGYELWKSDGTSSGTILVRDVMAALGASNPQNLINFGGNVVFVADDGLNGRELWASDGTSAGTRRILDANLGSGGSSPNSLAIANNRLYFAANNGTTGSELWVLDSIPTVTLSAVSALSENGGVTTVSATLNTPTTYDINVNVSFSGTATNNVDYSVSAMSITIPAGNSTGSIALTGLNDLTFEGNESVVVDVVSVMGGTENGIQQVSATIVDDETVPLVNLASSPTSLNENGGITTITATLTNPSTQPMVVDLGFAGSAIFGVDYSVSTTSIFIAAGETSASTTVTVRNDTVDESNEVVTIDVSSVTGGVENGSQQVTVTIIDDDLPLAQLRPLGLHHAFSVGGVGQDGAWGVDFDAFGNSLVVGGFRETADFDPGPGVVSIASGLSYAEDIFVAKYSPNGELIWAKSVYGPQGFDFVEDVRFNNFRDSFVMVGSFERTVDFDLGPGALSLSSSGGGHDGFVAKYDTNGNILWAFRIGGSGSDSVEAVRWDSEGNLLVAGYFSGIADFDPSAVNASLTSTGGLDAFIAKYDTNGSFIWVRQFAGVQDGQFRGLAIDATDAVLATGNFSGSIDLDPTIGAQVVDSRGDRDVMNVKLNSDGSLAWGFAIGSIGDDRGQTIGVDSQSSVYVSGLFSGTMDFDPRPAVYELGGASTATFVSKFNSDGILQWASRLARGPAGYRGRSLAIGGDDTVYLSAPFNNAGDDFDPGPSEFALSTMGDNDVSVTALTPQGEFLWAGKLGGAGRDNSGSLAINSSGTVYVVGQWGLFNPTGDFDPGPGSYVLTGQGVYDIFLAALSPAPVVNLKYSGLLSVSEASSNLSLVITLDQTSSQPTVVTLGSSGSATSGLDYALSAQVTIPPGGTSAGTTLVIFDDNLFEGDETVSIQLNTTSQGTAGVSREVAITILDNDPYPAVSLNLLGSPIAENLGVGYVIALLSNPSTQDVTVNLTFSGTATNDVDYSASQASILILAGDTSGSITLTGVDDTTIEGSEAAVIDVFSVASGIEDGFQQVVVTIVDDDNSSPVNTVPSSQSVNEDTALVIGGISISDVDAGTANVSVTLSVANGTLTLSTNAVSGVTSGAISGNGGASVTLTGSQSAINATLASVSGVTYQGTLNFNGTDTLTVTTNDLGNSGAGGALNDTDTVAITVNAVNDGPTGVNDLLSSIAEDSGNYTIPFASLLGNDSTGPSNESGQALTITNVGSAVGGTVTIVGSNVIFTPTANYNGPASFSYTLRDNGTTNLIADPKSATATASFTITEVNDAPSGVADNLGTLTGATTIPFATLLGNDSKGPANESGQTLMVTAVDSAVGGTVGISGSNVIFTPTSGYSGPGSFVYTLQDNGTTNSLLDAKTATATASFAISAAGITLNPGIAKPAVDLNGPAANFGNSVTFTEGSTGVLLATADATLLDSDSAALANVTVSLLATPDGSYESLVAAVTGTEITAAYNSTTRVLTLTGPDTIGNFQQVLRTVRYLNTSNSPTTTARTARVVANDGANSSLSRDVTINVVAINNPPSISITATPLSFVENGAPMVIDSAVVPIELDSVAYVGGSYQISLQGATISVSPWFAGEDKLIYTSTAGIGATIDQATGVLRMTAITTLANYQTALRAIQYQNTSDNPTTGSRVVTFTVNDGASTSSATRTINVTAVNDAPTADLSGPVATGNNHSTTYRTSVGSIPIAYSTSTVTDPDNATMTSLTVTIANVQNLNNEVLTYTLPGGISASAPSNTAATVVFTGSASPATYQTLLRSIQYRNLAGSPTLGTPRSITVVTNDGTATQTSTTTVTLVSPLQATSAPTKIVADKITSADLRPIVQAAIGRWATLGLTSAQVAQLQSTSYVVANLGLARELGQASSGKVVTIDDNAAGFGWFVDSTPRDDREFTKAISKSERVAPGMTRMDLLTVVMHEMGHILDLPDIDDDKSTGVMTDTIAPGTRRVSAAADLQALAWYLNQSSAQTSAPIRNTDAARAEVFARWS